MKLKLNENDLVFAKVKPNAIIPTKNEEDAGYDIYACFDEDFFVIPSHSTVLVPTGIASAVSNKYYLNVAERGSTGKIGMKYSAGIIDSGYRGEIFIQLSNINETEIIISKLTREKLIEKYGKKSYWFNGSSIVLPYGDEEIEYPYLEHENSDCVAIIYPYEKAIAQLIIHEVPIMNQYEVTYEELKSIPSKRGNGKLGSSGK